MVNVKKNDKTRINLNIPTSIVDKVKKYADEMGLNLTSAFIVLINKGLEQNEIYTQLPMLTALLNSAKSFGKEDNLDK